MGRMYSTTHECTLKVAFDFLLCSQIIILEIVPHCDLKKDKEDLINFVIAFIDLHILQVIGNVCMQEGRTLNDREKIINK